LNTKTGKFYKVTYRDATDGKIQKIDVTKIADSPLGLSFIALSGFLFEKSSILVDPEMESRIKAFEAIKTLHLSMYSVISIAELGNHLMPLSFDKDKSNLVVLPSSPTPPPGP